MENIMQKTSIAAAVAAMADPRLQDQAVISAFTASIHNAIALSQEASSAKSKLDQYTSGTDGKLWPAWRDVAAQAATIRLEPSEVKDTIRAMAEKANVKASTLGAYASKCAGLVPILAMTDAAFAALAQEAGTPDAGKDCNGNDAASLIRAYKARQAESNAAYARRAIDDLATFLKIGLKVSTEGATQAQAAKARDDAALRVLGRVEAAFAAIGETMPEQRGERKAGKRKVGKGKDTDTLAEPAQDAKDESKAA
jgi:hypothetical protein